MYNPRCGGDIRHAGDMGIHARGVYQKTRAECIVHYKIYFCNKKDAISLEMSAMIQWNELQPSNRAELCGSKRKVKLALRGLAGFTLRSLELENDQYIQLYGLYLLVYLQRPQSADTHY